MADSIYPLKDVIKNSSINDILKNAEPHVITMVKAAIDFNKGRISSIKDLESLVTKILNDINLTIAKLIILLPEIEDENDQFLVYLWLTIIYREISIFYKLIQRRDKIRATLETLIRLLESAPSNHSFELVIFDAYFEIGHILYEMKASQEDQKRVVDIIFTNINRLIKYNATELNEIYQKFRKYFHCALRFYGFGTFKSIGSKIKQYYCFSLIYYKRYLENVTGEENKAVYFGIQSLTFQIKCNVMWSPAEWISVACACAVYCSDHFLLAQADYLLEAAQMVYEKYNGCTEWLIGDPFYLTHRDEKMIKYLLEVSYIHKDNCYLTIITVDAETRETFGKLFGFIIDAEKNKLKSTSKVEIKELELNQREFNLSDYENNVEKGKALFKNCRQRLDAIKSAGLSPEQLETLEVRSEERKLAIALLINPDLAQ